MGKEDRKPIKKGEFNQNITSKDIISFLNNLSPQEKSAFLAQIRYQEIHRSFNGPLPAPEDFKQYESVLPGAADRIISMAEKQQLHRTSLEKEIVDRNFNQSSRGQIIGGILAICYILASFVLGLYGHETLAGIIATTTLLGTIVVFVLNKKPDHDNEDSTNRNEKE